MILLRIVWNFWVCLWLLLCSTLLHLSIFYRSAPVVKGRRKVLVVLDSSAVLHPHVSPGPRPVEHGRADHHVLQRRGLQAKTPPCSGSLSCIPYSNIPKKSPSFREKERPCLLSLISGGQILPTIRCIYPRAAGRRASRCHGTPLLRTQTTGQRVLSQELRDITSQPPPLKNQSRIILITSVTLPTCSR